MNEFKEIEHYLNQNKPDQKDLKQRYHKIDHMYIPNDMKYDNIYFNTMQ